MCGIAGIVEWRDGDVEKDRLVRQMLGMIRHRGPDQFGIYLDQRAALGSARLSIIDLACGQQPIQNEDGNLWVVFNGEIFNYIELREELEAKGHRFRTHTDTEVILHLYEDLGPDCLKRFNGQFAIAIWDKRNEVLFLARDRVGVRPLFYTEATGRFLFASEIKALFADDSIVREIDFNGLDQVFTFWAPLGPGPLFRNVLEIPPGHYALVTDGKCALHRYWEVDFTRAAGGEDSSDPEEAADRLRELLIDATRIRLRADVPVGAYLSGGLDSSTIAAIVRNYMQNKLATFSIAFCDGDYDESPFQQQMADHLGTQHHVVRATHRDIGEAFPDVVWHTETPLMRTSPAPMFLLSRLVRQTGFKVVLTGEGADEFLGGYDIFKEAKVRRFWAKQPDSKTRPLLLQRLYADIPRMSRSGPSFLAAFFKERLAEIDLPCYSHFIRWRNNRRTRRFFSDAILQQTANDTEDSLRQVAVPSQLSRWGGLERAQYLEVSIFLSQYLLSSQGDRVAMAHSVEGRYPFLDREVMEFCSGLSARHKLRGLTEKYILRKVARNWLPDAILKRSKRPYRAPIHRSFFGGANFDYVNEVLSEEYLKKTGLFNPRGVGHLLQRVRTASPLGETDEMALAGIISSQLLHRQFVDNFKKARSIGEEDDLKLCRGSAGRSPASDGTHVSTN